MEGDRYNDDSSYFTTSLREFRHSPCMMTPLSLIMISIFGVFMLCTLLFQIPGVLLGLLLAPILSRSAMYVQFLYPWGIARFFHLYIIGSMNSASASGKDDRNRGFHSRCAEQRFEVVPGRVYIHPIPQFIDNMGYLIVCIPPSRSETIISEDDHTKIVTEDDSQPVIAFMIDCGDAAATNRAIALIRQFHYRKRNIQLQVLCSTHKHHDHTGGNKQLLQDHASTLKVVYGGAVEKVPYCTHPLRNGDILDLPKYGESNDMNDLVEIECIAVPAHTRGSVVFRLHVKESCSATDHPAPEFLFTGDTMFSAGGGVSFEADIGNIKEADVNRSNGNTQIRANLGMYAMERCFAEILARPMPASSTSNHKKADCNRLMILPGHEYTTELLTRQLQSAMLESCRWKNFPPKEFFEVCSNMYTAIHRRNLPHNSGRLLAIPSTLSREIVISPQFRTMKRNGELIVRAVIFWHSYFCKHKVTDLDETRPSTTKSQANESCQINGDRSSKTTSYPTRWTVGVTDIGRDIFTTVYSDDFDSVLKDFESGGLSQDETLRRLKDLKRQLEEPVVHRRPIPGNLPSNKTIFKAIAGLVLLGSPPSAMTLSDARRMNMAPPIDSNSDRIQISLKRLIVVLERLGLLEEEDNGGLIKDMLRQLWLEAQEFVDDKCEGDVEGELVDLLELGVLKYVLYGVPANQPSWFSKMCCLPCSNIPPPRTFPTHLAAKMHKKPGELVSHDVLQCKLCRNVTGCVHNILPPDEDNSPKESSTEADVADSSSRRLVLKETISGDSLEGDHGVEMEGIASQLLSEHE